MMTIMLTRRQLLVIASVSGIVLAGVFGSGLRQAWSDSPPASQEYPVQLLQSVSNTVFEDYGHGLLPATAADRASVRPPSSDEVKAALGRGGATPRLKEPPVLVRFREPVPGAKGTEGLMLAVVLDETPVFGGSGLRGGHTPAAAVVGTYWILFLDPVTLDVVYGISGEMGPKHAPNRVLKSSSISYGLGR